MAKGKAPSLLNDPKPGQFDVPPFTVSNWADQVGLAVAIFSGSVYYLFHFANALPGAEFQDWITWPFSGAFAWDKVSHALFREGSHFSRDLSMLYVRASGSICGLNIPCLNSSAFLPVGLSAGLLYILGRNLGLKPILAAAAVLFWWFSAPTASTMAWQATINDRLVLLFVLVALIAALYTIDRELKWKTAIVSNLGIGLPLLIAYNCKESSFFLAPLLLVLWILFRHGDWKRRVEGGLLILLPIAYASYHNLRYFFFQLPSSGNWQNHSTGSPVSEHLESFALGLISALPKHGGLLSVGMLLALTAGVLLGFQLAKSPTTFLRSNRSVLLCLAGFVGSFALPLRTQPDTLFYMYVPLAFFSLTVFLVLSPWSLRLPKTTLWKTIEALFLIGLLSAQFVRFEKHLIGWHLENAVFSQNFISGLTTLHDNVSVTQIESLVLIRPPNPRYYHNFRPTTERQSIWRYALSAEELTEIGSGPVRAQYASVEDQRELQESASSDDMAFFDDSMKLVALKSNGRLTRFEMNESSP